MKRILFVDDEPMVLRALGNVFRKDKDRWEMLFAPGAAAALAIMATAPVDVVVTDMRMPGMDGATLLERVEALYPETRRIILSGQADPSATATARRSAHHVLEKPCPTDVLRRTIDGLLDLGSSRTGTSE
jgi:DNA-binding NtrC family response regulator